MITMSHAQGAVCEEVVTDLERLRGMLATCNLEDPLASMLRIWAVYLAVLGAEMLRATLILVRRNEVRAAFALSRTLIEYYIRIRYYKRDADQTLSGWQAGELGPAGLNNTMAYRDWHNAEAKLRGYMKKMPDLDMTMLSAETRADFELLRQNERIHTQRWNTMRDVAETIEARSKFIDVEYGLRSGYLHGDQSGGYEVVLMGAEERGGAASIVGQFSQHRVAAYAAQYAVLLMEAIGKAVGRSFAVSILGPKLAAAFSLERRAVMMEPA